MDGRLRGQTEFRQEIGAEKKQFLWVLFVVHHGTCFSLLKHDDTEMYLSSLLIFLYFPSYFIVCFLFVIYLTVFIPSFLLLFLCFFRYFVINYYSLLVSPCDIFLQSSFSFYFFPIVYPFLIFLTCLVSFYLAI